MSAMSQLVQDGWHGYIAAGFVLASSVLPFLVVFGLGVVAGVRLLGLRSRGLALGLAWVGILLWLRGSGSGGLGNPEGMSAAWWPGRAYAVSSLSGLVIKGLGVAGYVYVNPGTARMAGPIRQSRRIGRGPPRHEHHPRIAGPARQRSGPIPLRPRCGLRSGTRPCRARSCFARSGGVH